MVQSSSALAWTETHVTEVLLVHQHPCFYHPPQRKDEVSHRFYWNKTNCRALYKGLWLCRASVTCVSVEKD